MGLFNRNPQDIADAFDGDEETPREQREAYLEDKYVRKGIERAARALGLENLRSVDAAPYHSRVEGELLVDGEPVTVELGASAFIGGASGLLGAYYEQPIVMVDVLDESQPLGRVNYEWSSHPLIRVKENYRSHESSETGSKLNFLTSLQDAIRSGRKRDIATDPAPPVGAPTLSALGSSPDRPEPASPRPATSGPEL